MYTLPADVLATKPAKDWASQMSIYVLLHIVASNIGILLGKAHIAGHMAMGSVEKESLHLGGRQPTSICIHMYIFDQHHTVLGLLGPSRCEGSPCNSGVCIYRKFAAARLALLPAALSSLHTKQIVALYYIHYASALPSILLRCKIALVIVVLTIFFAEIVAAIASC